MITGLTKVTDINPIRDFKCVCCPKLPELLPFLYKLVSIIVIIILGSMTWRCWGIIDTFRPTVMCGKYVYLATVGDFYHNRGVVNWKGLLPRFSINPHKCVISSTFVKLKADPVGLKPIEWMKMLLLVSIIYKTEYSHRKTYTMHTSYEQSLQLFTILSVEHTNSDENIAKWLLRLLQNKSSCSADSFALLECSRKKLASYFTYYLSKTSSMPIWSKQYKPMPSVSKSNDLNKAIIDIWWGQVSL